MSKPNHLVLAMLLLKLLDQAHGECCAQSGSFNSAQTGILKLGLSNGSRDGYIYVPSQYDPAKGNAMILAIHAAGRGGLDALQLLIALANSSGKTLEVLLLVEVYAGLVQQQHTDRHQLLSGGAQVPISDQAVHVEARSSQRKRSVYRHHSAGTRLSSSHVG